MLTHYIHTSTGRTIVTATSNTIQTFDALYKALNQKATLNVYNTQAQQKIIITFDTDVTEDDITTVINNVKKGEQDGNK